jgi:hypothetical protein
LNLRGVIENSPAVKGKLKKRQEEQPPELLQISWKPQTRLNKKYFRLLSRGKVAGKAITAVASGRQGKHLTTILGFEE